MLLTLPGWVTSESVDSIPIQPAWLTQLVERETLETPSIPPITRGEHGEKGARKAGEFKAASSKASFGRRGGML